MLDIAKLLIITGVPAWLIYTRKHTAAVSWLAVILPISIFSASFLINVTGLAAFGLVSLPYVLHEIKNRITHITRGEALVVLSCVLMSIGMVIYGFLFPWPDLTGQRAINQCSVGRSVIFTGRYIFEFSAALYVASVVGRQGQPNRLMRCLLIGTVVVAIGVFLQLATGIDLFYHLSSYDERNLSELGRARGFSYEPRTAAQWCTVGVILCIVLTDLGRVRWLVLGMLLAAMAATLSTSGLLLLSVCLCVSAVYVTRARRAAVALGLVVVLLLGAAASIPALRSYVETFGLLLQSRWLLEGREPVVEGWFEQIRNHLEAFDYAAVGFLAANPQYLPFGTGPGVIPIPATEFATPRDLQLYGGRIDSIPLMGLVLIVSNVGIVGLYVWFLLVHRCRQAIRKMYEATGDPQWRDNYVLLTVFTVYYLLIFREMWLLSVAVGLGAALIVQRTEREREAAVSAPRLVPEREGT